MRAIGTLKIYGVIAAVAAIVCTPSYWAYSASCWDQLTKAEKRWSELRARTEMPANFERKVTRHLVEAAELRHQGMPDRCLLEVKEAVKEMNLGAGETGPQSQNLHFREDPA